MHSLPPKIRCGHCRQQASSAYAICPNCGRELHGAASSWISWAIPALLVALLAIVLLGRLADGPWQWLAERTASTLAVVENPVLTPVTESAEGSAGNPLPPATETSELIAVAVPSETPTEPPPTDTPEPTTTPTASPLPTDTATETPTDIPVDTATPSVTPTAIPVAVETAAQTLTGTPTAGSVNGERVYSVQAGDTAFSIANRFQVTVAELLKVNQLAPTQALQLKSGTVLLIPGRGPLPSPTATPTAPPPAATATSAATATAAVQATLPGQQLYTVASGDTFVGIALRFSIGTDALLAANSMTIDQAKDLRPGQKLIIPAAGQPLPPTATPGLRRYIVQAGDTIVVIAASNGISAELLLSVNRMTAAQAPSIRPGDELIIPPPGYVLPTNTPRPTVAPTATPTPKVTIRLDAPVLLDPAQGINVPCSANQIIRWNAVNGLVAGDEYVLFLGYVNSAPDGGGNVAVVPLLEQRTGQRTNWPMDTGYCNVPPQEFGRRWRWYVQIFNGRDPVSPASQVWEFSWR